MKRGRLVVFVGFDPRSQRSLRRLGLLIERLKDFYEVSLVHVPDDLLGELPYVRVEPLGDSADSSPRGLVLSDELRAVEPEDPR